MLLSGNKVFQWCYQEIKWCNLRVDFVWLWKTTAHKIIRNLLYVHWLLYSMVSFNLVPMISPPQWSRVKDCDKYIFVCRELWKLLLQTWMTLTVNCAVTTILDKSQGTLTGLDTSQSNYTCKVSLKKRRSTPPSPQIQHNLSPRI